MYLIGNTSEELSITQTTTERNLTCSFPFMVNQKWHNECQPSGINGELCFCGVNPENRNIDMWYEEQKIKYGADIKMRRGEKLSVDYANLDSVARMREIKDKTIWDFCRCPAPNRNIPIYTDPRSNSLHPDQSMKCHFPFHYEEFTYHQCIDLPTPTPVVLESGNLTRYGTGCWCGLVPNVNNDPTAWGYCPCSVTVTTGEWSSWEIRLKSYSVIHTV